MTGVGPTSVLSGTERMEKRLEGHGVARQTAKAR